jgi:hypothetical protein
MALAASALAAPAFAQDDAMANPLASCDSTVQALVWAAEDAYGYDVTTVMSSTMMPATGTDTMSEDMDDDSDDDMEMTPEPEATPEATEAAKLLNTAKVNTAVRQDNMNMMVNCDAIREDVVAFIYAQNNMSTVPTFSVEGEEIAANFEALLSGPQEVPGPGDADGQGTALISVNGDTNTVCWNIQVGGIDLPAAAAHIHTGAEGEAGGVVVPLSAPSLEGVSSGCVEADAAVVQAILANPTGHYVNVHSASFPDGAVRGQLLGL